MQQRVATLWRMGQRGSRTARLRARASPNGENSMLLKWLSRSVAALTTLSLALAAPLQARDRANGAGGHPAMWKLSDRDTTIYLFGTFHLLPQGQNWRTPAFDK